MALKTEAIGKSWPAFEYEVGREKIREFADAVGAVFGVFLHREGSVARERPRSRRPCECAHTFDAKLSSARSSTSRIAIKSISQINSNVVSVRYTRTITRGEDVRTTHWVATITYSYANAPISSSDRLVNPLGFVVSEYRADPEALN